METGWLALAGLESHLGQPVSQVCSLQLLFGSQSAVTVRDISEAKRARTCASALRCGAT